ncbi:MAG: GNAT family N-acetyltransferase [Tepidisphaeraceae bacterium]
MEIESVQIGAVDVEEIIDLRHAILRAGLARETAYFPGDHDSRTVHLAAKYGKAIVACATVLVNQWEGRPACQLRGMAVDPAYQRRGVGRRLLAEIERVAVENSVGLIWANARAPAAEFYRKHGWEIVSEEFEIPTAGPHFKMVRKL